MRKHISTLKKDYDSIEVPPELDIVIEKAIRKGRRARHVGWIYKPLAAAVALILVFIFSVNLSPALARYVSNMPGMESLINLVSFDKGLVDIVDRGFVQIIDQSSTDNGITVTVESAIYDGHRVILAVKIESERQLEKLGSVDFQLLGGSAVRGIVSSQNEQSTHTFRKVVDFLIQSPAPKDFMLKCSSIEHIFETLEGTQSESISGDWYIIFRLDTELSEFEPRQIKYNEGVIVRVGSARFRLESTKIYPTIINVKIIPDNSTLRITGFRNPRIIDEDGYVYDFKSYFMGSNNKANCDVLSFESNYFVESEHLTLVMDGIYTLPKQEVDFVIDIEKGRVLDDGGLGIEFLRTSLDVSQGREELKVWFKVNDREFRNSEPKFFWVNQYVHDMSKKMYKIVFFQSTDGNEDEFAISFDATQEIPRVIRVTVDMISKGIEQPMQIKLK